jgi:cell division protein FtsN
VFIYYRSGARQSGEPPVVGQPLGDIKQAAPASSQPTDEAAGLSIYKAEEAPASAAPTFTAPPEQPQPLPVAPKVRVPAVQSALKGPVAPSATAEDAAASEAGFEVLPAKPAKAPAQAKPPVETAPAAAGGAHMVQIGAYSSKPLAEKGWNDVAKLMPGDMFGRTESFEPVTKNGETLYRTFVGGFGSKADAQAFCDALKGQGHTCMAK